MMELPQAVKTWHKLIETKKPEGLEQLLSDEVDFWSPVVHTPQIGKAAAKLYLSAAFYVIATPNFKYVRQTISDDFAVLEFETELNGIYINGVDMFHWNSDGQIDQFKVMIRPLKAVNQVHQMMGQMLHKLGPKNEVRHQSA